MAQHSFLDRFVHRDSPIHRLDPRVKILVTLAFVAGNVLLPDGAWVGFALALLLTLAISRRAHLGGSFALRRSFVALPFMLAGFSVLFAGTGQVLAAGQVGPFDLTVTSGGLLRFVSLMLRTWLSVQMAILLTATTPFPDLAHALRHLRVPAVIVAIISLMYRYLFVLVEEAQRLLRARAARSAALPGQPSGGAVTWRATVAGRMAGQLFVRSLDRSDRVYQAMVARGYRGQLLTMNRHTMRRADWGLAGTAALALLVIQIAGRLV